MSLATLGSLRTWQTRISEVQRITVQSGGRGGTTWTFTYPGGTAKLGNGGGKRLAGYIVDRNTQVDCLPVCANRAPARAAPTT